MPRQTRGLPTLQRREWECPRTVIRKSKALRRLSCKALTPNGLAALGQRRSLPVISDHAPAPGPRNGRVEQLPPARCAEQSLRGLLQRAEVRRAGSERRAVSNATRNTATALLFVLLTDSLANRHPLADEAGNYGFQQGVPDIFLSPLHCKYAP